MPPCQQSQELTSPPAPLHGGEGCLPDAGLPDVYINVPRLRVALRLPLALGERGAGGGEG